MARESLTSQLLLAMGDNRLIADDLGLIHWYAPRNSSDSRPWTNSHQTRPRTRDLRAVPAPAWSDLLRLAHRLGFDPKPSLQLVRLESCRGWIATAASGSFGLRAEAAPPPRSTLLQPRWRMTVWIGAILGSGAEDERVERHHLRDAQPADCLYWANRMGVLGNLTMRYRAEGRDIRVKTGEPWRELDREVSL